MVATVVACSEESTRETLGATNPTQGPQTTNSELTGTSSGSTGTPTTGETSGTGSGGVTTSTTDPSGSSTGDVSTTGSSTGTSTTGTSTTGPAPSCGDGVVDVGEDCDGGGESKDCNADCTAAACGDGKLNAVAGEACDGGGESKDCNADCTAAACGDGKLNPSAGETCEGQAPANASCEACDVACLATFDDCNADLGDGCEVNLQSDAKNCGSCNNACPNNVQCKLGKCAPPVVDAFNQYDSEGRTVYIFKSTMCADLNQNTTYCENKGLTWWKAKSQADAQKLIDVAFGLDQWHTWIQVYGATSTLGSVDGFNVTVDSPDCVDASPNGWTAFRKWGCSFCEPTNNQAQSCCWDKDHLYDWFVCQS